MAKQPPPASSFPPSMGPGAMPYSDTNSPADAYPNSTSSEAVDPRTSYVVGLTDDAITIRTLEGRDPLYQVYFDNMPLTGYKRWLLYGGPTRAYASSLTFSDLLRRTETIADRHLTQQEAEGLAYQSSRRSLFSATGNLLGVAAGYTIAWRSRGKMKFPFRAPQPLTRYSNFPNRYIPLFRGEYARTAWHMTRANIWAFLWVVLLSPVFSTMGAYSFAVGLGADQRTKHLADMITQFSKDQRNDLHRRLAQREGERAARQQGDSHSKTSTGQLYPQRTTEASEDQHPQEWERDSATNSESQTGTFRDAESFESQKSIPSSSRTTARPQPPPDQTSRQDQGVFFYEDNDTSSNYDDDASPTAGNRNRSPSQGGNTWARIRRGESSTSPSQPAPQSGSSQDSSPSAGGWRRSETPSQREPQFQNSSDSFSFSKTEADKQFARDQAQKEFDDMLDRERKQSGSDDYDRGMKAVASGQENQANSGMSSWEQRRRRD
ncbi:hypothetical protein LTR84_012401 [Exophiala bonariae]|uniref:Uncharacterized protein n=1 Tax=Exophiala bonariae TaxID=1690606 RepID=A0AAV9MRD0_9EURO|nr:hypothetical protein LTR84_012401 [Exophiala bonariae]